MQRENAERDAIHQHRAGEQQEGGDGDRACNGGSQTRVRTLIFPSQTKGAGRVV